MLYNIYDDYFKEEIMARKQKFDGGTANEIARVAVKEFSKGLSTAPACVLSQTPQAAKRG